MPVQPRKIPYICARSLSKRTRRLYSSRSTPPPPPPPSGAAKLTNRRLISVHGQDAPKFLQGLVTNDVQANTTAGFYAAFLTAPGKVLHDVLVYPTAGSQWQKQQHGDFEPGYLIELDGEQAETLQKHLKRHKLRSKFKLRILEDGELDVWSSWREGDRRTAHGQTDSPSNIISLTDIRAPGMGQRLLLPSSSARRDETFGGVPEAPLEAYTLRRYLRGVPEGQHEMPREDCLPMNCNLDLMGGINFKKGCYLGQELTIRTHHTGVVRRRILPVVVYPCDGQPPEQLAYDPEVSPQNDVAELSGIEIKRDDKRQRSTGKFLAGIGNIGLGMCRLETMSDLVVSSEPNTFTAENRFLMLGADGREVGVKAFVPDWLRGRIRAPKMQKRVE